MASTRRARTSLRIDRLPMVGMSGPMGRDARQGTRLQTSAMSSVRKLRTCSGRRLGVLAAIELPPAPRPDAIDLHLERETEEDPDHDDDAKNGDALECRVDDYRPDDVGDDQDLEAEQNAAAQVPAQCVVGPLRRLGVQGTGCEHEKRTESAENHDPRPERLNDLDDFRDHLLVAAHACLPYVKKTHRSRRRPRRLRRGEPYQL